MMIVTESDFFHVHQQMEQDYREFWHSPMSQLFPIKPSKSFLFLHEEIGEDDRLKIKVIDPLDIRAGEGIS
jgi:hypothetical protein